MVVRTHAQAKQEELEETQRVTGEKEGGVQLKLLEDETAGDAVIETEEVVHERNRATREHICGGAVPGK